MFLMMSRGFRYQTSYVAVFHSGSRVSGTWILDRKFRPICKLFFFKLFYSNFIAFKLTFIQFNSHAPLPFQSYFQTSRQDEQTMMIGAILLHSAKRMEATIVYLCIGTRRTPRGDCRGWPPTRWTQGLSS